MRVFFLSGRPGTATCDKWQIAQINGVLGLKLGLIGFVFAEAEGVVYFHNPLL